VFDPFAGWGSTLLACAVEGRRGVGVEIDAARCERARERLASYPGQTVVHGDARRPPIPAGSAALVLTDLPYFGTTLPDAAPPDGTFYALARYDEYLTALDEAFAAVARTLRPGGRMVVSAQNRRVDGAFVPMAWDAARILGRYLTLGDERVHLYEKRDTGGDPAVTNRAHEYVLVATRA